MDYVGLGNERMTGGSSLNAFTIQSTLMNDNDLPCICDARLRRGLRRWSRRMRLRNGGTKSIRPDAAMNAPARLKVRYHCRVTSNRYPAKGGPTRLDTPCTSSRSPYACENSSSDTAKVGFTQNHRRTDDCNNNDDDDRASIQTRDDCHCRGYKTAGRGRTYRL